MIIGNDRVIGRHRIAAIAYMDDIDGIERNGIAVGRTIEKIEAQTEKTMTSISPEKTHVMCMGRQQWAR